MGMYDHLYVQYPLPDPEVQFFEFQTKSLDSAMSYYTINFDGCLIHHQSYWETVPEWDRPYWGTPEWETKPFVRSFGCINTVSTGDVYMHDFDGSIRFYTSYGDMWYEYIAWFRNGQLKDLVSKHRKFGE